MTAPHKELSVSDLESKSRQAVRFVMRVIRDRSNIDTVGREGHKIIGALVDLVAQGGGPERRAETAPTESVHSCRKIALG